MPSWVTDWPGTISGLEPFKTPPAPAPKPDTSQEDDDMAYIAIGNH